MGMTMTQKILAAHAGLDHVEAGQLIEAAAGSGSGQRHYKPGCHQRDGKNEGGRCVR